MGEENDIWADDLLGDRKAHANFLERFLVAKGNWMEGVTANRQTQGAFVLNINAPWGSGKTYFLERFQKQLEQKHVVVHVDAWRFDYVDDPLVPVIDAFKVEIAKLPREGKIKSKAKAFVEKSATVVGIVGKGALKQTAKRFIGDAVDDLFDDDAGTVGTLSEEVIKGGADALLDRMAKAGRLEAEGFERARQAVDEFTSALQDLATEVDALDNKQGPVIVLIDELDRCRPLYAIQMLERIKHLFGVRGVVFVLATNTEQLEHSIRSVYGIGFDANLYLQRFFNRTYSFGSRNTEELIKTRILEAEIPEDALITPFDVEHAKLIADMAESLKLTARDIERLIQLLADAVLTKNFKSPIVIPFFIYVAFAIERNHPQLLKNEVSPGRNSLEGALNEKLVGLGVTLPRFSIPGQHQSRKDEYSTLDLVARILEWRTSSLERHPKDMMNIAGDMSVAGWVAQLQIDERHREGMGGMSVSRSTSSVLLQYEDLIKSAGRLSS